MIKHMIHEQLKTFSINGFMMNQEIREKYLCNTNKDIPKEKSTYIWSKVNCKKCLKIRLKIIEEHKKELKKLGFIYKLVKK